MAGGIGDLFGGLARGATAGMQLDQGQQRIDLAAISEKRQEKIQNEQLQLTRETLQIKRDQAALQIKDMQLVGQVAQGLQTSVEGDSEVNQFIETGKGLGSVDSSIRAPLVDQYVAGFKEQYGVDMAPVVVATLKKAKPEVLQGVFSALEDQIAQDPSMTPEKLTKMLSDPMAAASAIVSLTGEAKRLQDRAAVQSPDVLSGELMKKRAVTQRAKIEAQIANIDQALPNVSTKAGLDKILSLKTSLMSQLNTIDTQLRQDTTETLDRGDRVEVIDKVSGQVIRTLPKSPAPTAGSNRLFDVVGADGEIVGRAVFNSQSNRPVMEGTGEPVPAGTTLRGIGTGGGLTVESDGAGGFRVTTGGGGKGGMTSASRTESEKQITSAEQFSLDVKDLLTRLDAGDVGVVGNVTELFRNKILAQVNPKFGDAQTAEDRTKLRQIAETAVKVFGAPPFSNMDRLAAQRLVASTGWLTSELEAKATLGMVAQIADERASYAAGTLGRKPLTDLSPQEMHAAVNADKLDARTGLRALQLLHPGFLEEFAKKRGGAGRGAE